MASSLLEALLSGLLAAAAPGDLAALPGPTSQRAVPPGLGRIEGAALYVPPGLAGDRPAPMLLLLPGTGGSGRQMIEAVRWAADRYGVVLLAPSPGDGENWDSVDAFFDEYERGSAAGRTRWPTPQFGRDARRIDSALEALFARLPVDRERIGILGYSHGASYALSLGAANPQLFSAIIALSPGILVLPERPQGRQFVYLSHGERDTVQPYRRTRESFAPRLVELGFRVTFRPFDGGHVMPAETVDEGIRLFLAESARQAEEAPVAEPR